MPSEWTHTILGSNQIQYKLNSYDDDDQIQYKLNSYDDDDDNDDDDEDDDDDDDDWVKDEFCSNILYTVTTSWIHLK